MRIFAQNCLIDGTFVPALLGIENGHIVQIDVNPSSEVADYSFKSGYLVPGLIDLQLNGGFGVDFSSGNGTEISAVFSQLPSTGTTSICPTVISSPFSDIEKQVVLLNQITKKSGSSKNLGVHLEGPFISPSRRGAHKSEFLKNPSEIELSDAFLKLLRIFTVAPELSGTDSLIQRANKLGVLVSLGHSEATYAETVAAANSGARMVTHTFNGQRKIHQREPGISIAALLEDQLSPGLIVDGEHVAFELIEMAIRLSGNRMCVVSDASAALMADPGTSFDLGGTQVTVDESGSARRKDGTLASSGMTQLQAIEKCVANGLNREKLLTAATLNPARLIGEESLGQIALGATADIVHYTVDNEVVVDFVLIDGVLCNTK